MIRGRRPVVHAPEILAVAEGFRRADRRAMAAGSTIGFGASTFGARPLATLLFAAASIAHAQGVVEAGGTRVLHDDARRGFALAVLVESPRAEDRVLSTLGLSTPREKTVVVVRNQTELDRAVREATGGGAPDWAGAVAAPALRTVWIRVDLPRKDDYAIRALLAHEYAHLALHEARLARGALFGPPRRWVEEGFAQIAAGRLRLDERVDLRPAAFFGTLHDPAALDLAFRGGEGAAAKAYAQAEAFLRRLDDRHGSATIPKLVRYSLDGADVEAAVFRACGVSFDDAWAGFVRELRNDRTWMAEVAASFFVAVFIGGVALLAYARLRERRRRARARWDAEEAAAAATADDETKEADAFDARREDEGGAGAPPRA
jgi:hypothetical protein